MREPPQHGSHHSRVDSADSTEGPYTRGPLHAEGLETTDEEDILTYLAERPSVSNTA